MPFRRFAGKVDGLADSGDLALVDRVRVRFQIARTIVPSRCESFCRCLASSALLSKKASLVEKKP
jgi:hypothetical protein